MKQFTVWAAWIFITHSVQIPAMVHDTPPLHALSTLLFKQTQQEPVLIKDIRDAHAQFKMYRAIRNLSQMSTKNNSTSQLVPK